jgi:NADPH:quinone reductase-like Zn-dependent oxidoreductase
VTRRAIVLDDFGDSSNLKLVELPVPRVRRPDELLVRVRATSVNPIEWKMRQGLGLPKRLWRRLLGSPIVLGLDFSGDVIDAGDGCGEFRPGDAVMGALPLNGSYTTHLCLRVRDRRTAVTHKPPNVPHEKAALVPFAGLVAYAGLVTYGGLAESAPGACVLVVGASGGVGHLAVQIAKKALGAGFVAAVCSARNEDFVRACGADHVVAHDHFGVRALADLFPDWAHTFDLILDCVGIDEYFTHVAPRLLESSGRFVTAALPSFRRGRPGEDVGPLAGGALFARLLWRRVTAGYRLIPGLLGGLPTKDGIADLSRWMGEGKLVAHTAATYPLEEIATAHRQSETGRTVGKIAIEVR